jgi:hypothetical protein
MALICKEEVLLSFIEYNWLVYGKPFCTAVLAIAFGILSLIIIYAEIANIFHFEHNLIYDIVTAPDVNEKSPGYFYWSNVSNSI